MSEFVCIINVEAVRHRIHPAGTATMPSYKSVAHGVLPAMMNLLLVPSSRTVSNVALAYFVNPRNLHDAATDLCLAGFKADAINISGLFHGFGIENPEAARSAATAAFAEEHTLRWKMRRFLIHDRQRRGADQMSGDDRDSVGFPNPECTWIDLSGVLAEMNVPWSVVQLLRTDTRSERTFLLVDAEDRVDEASQILQMNGGELRTEYLYSA
ncbi:hypothetical protein [Tunturiibacter psychrotolerans]|uniref:hypothetical protein n=1 Tax=Tunturiibacter psychrotolerans TaxID=3069686 RepID=UPI003D1A866B